MTIDHTVDSNVENPIISIPIVECLINVRKNQIIISQVNFNPADTKVLKLFVNKQYYIVQFSKNNTGQGIIDFIKTNIVHKIKYQLYFENAIYEILLIICKSAIKNSEEGEQLEKIQNYQVGKTNHRSLDKTESELRKNTIGQIYEDLFEIILINAKYVK